MIRSGWTVMVVGLAFLPVTVRADEVPPQATPAPPVAAYQGLTKVTQALVDLNADLPVRWQHAWNEDTLRKYYPRKALKDGIEAVVLAQCDWAETGEITTCRILEETSESDGFGEATVRMLKRVGRVIPKRENEQLQAGEGLPVILRWKVQ